MKYEETVLTKFILSDNKIIKAPLYLYEYDDKDDCIVKTELNNKEYEGISESYFEALIELRKKLEKDAIQICCNGAALNVYPSPMALSMGSGRRAYRMTKGKQAKMNDLVDIFDYDESLIYVSIDEQSAFYSGWLDSLKTGNKNEATI